MPKTTQSTPWPFFVYLAIANSITSSNCFSSPRKPNLPIRTNLGEKMAWSTPGHPDKISQAQHHPDKFGQAPSGQNPDHWGCHGSYDNISSILSEAEGHTKIHFLISYQSIFNLKIEMPIQYQQPRTKTVHLWMGIRSSLLVLELYARDRQYHSQVGHSRPLIISLLLVVIVTNGACRFGCGATEVSVYQYWLEEATFKTMHTISSTTRARVGRS